LALNPWLPFRLDLYERDFGETARIYEERGAPRGRWYVALHAARTMLRTDLLGPAVGALGALALLVAAGALLRRGAGGERTRLYVLVSFPAVYVAALALPAVHVTGHQWMPILPFVAVAAAEAMRKAVRRLPAAARRAVPVLTAALVAWLAMSGAAFVRRSVVPTPADCAAELLVQALRPGPALVASQVPLEGIRAPRLRGVVAVRTLNEVSAAAAFDGLVVRRASLDGGVAASAFAAFGAGAERRLCAPTLLSGGEALVVAIHRPPARGGREGIRLRGDGAGRLSGSFTSGSSRRVSFELFAPRDESSRRPALQLDGAPVELTWLGASPGRDQYATARMTVGPGVTSVDLEIGGALADRGRRSRPRLVLWNWAER
jgi:hypothetical protein